MELHIIAALVMREEAVNAPLVSIIQYTIQQLPGRRKHLSGTTDAHIQFYGGGGGGGGGII